MPLIVERESHVVLHRLALADLTIKDVAINIINSGRGIQAWHKALTVNDAKLEIATNGEASVCAGLTISTSKLKEGDTKATASAVSVLTRTTINSATMGSKNYVSIDPGYKLWIAGHRIFEGESIIAGAGITGSVKYDYATKMLALDGATITNTDGAGIVIKRSFSELVKKIVIKGNNTIKGVDDSGIFYESYWQGDALTISGENTASLDIIAYATTLSAGSPILIDDYAGVTIEGGCKVKLSDGIDGATSIDVNGTASGREILTVNGSRLELTSINPDIEIELLGGVKILSPSDIRLENKTLKDLAGNTYHGPVIFGIQTYNVVVDGKEITDLNKNDVLAGTANADKVKYDPSTKTLTLKGANLTIPVDMKTLGASNFETDFGVIGALHDLNIVLEGNNSIKCQFPNQSAFANQGIVVQEKLLIKGKGTLNIEADALNALGHNFAIVGTSQVVIQEATIISNNSKKGIHSDAGEIDIQSGSVEVSCVGAALHATTNIKVYPEAIIKEGDNKATATIVTALSGKQTKPYVNIALKVPVTGITIEPKTVNLTVGGTATVTATVAPANATNKDVTWTSSDEAIATVDATGKITAKAIGAAVIIATTVDGGKTATCNLTVSASVVAVTGVSISPTSLEMTYGESKTLTAIIAPENATNKNVTWKTNDPVIATVDANGKVTGLAVGIAVITVTTVDGGKTATCAVNVKSAEIKVTGITITPNKLTINKGESKKLTVSITPENASNTNVTWTSNDPTIATVDATGKVTGIAKGNATIIATTEDGGKTAFCNVTVADGTSVEEMRNNGINIWAADAAININIKDAKIAINDIQVFDINGNEVFSKLNPSENLRVELASGVYFVRIGELIQKVVLVK